MTETATPARRDDRLGEAYFAATSAAATSYLTTGEVPEPLARAVEVFASAMLASNAIGAINRLHRIATATEDIADLLDDSTDLD